MSLKVNTLKTEVLVQCTEPPQAPFQFHLHGEPIKTVEHFTYLGSIDTQDCSLNMEIQKEDKLCLTSIWPIVRDRVFSNNNLRIGTKAAVYRIVISILLYGSEIWTLHNCKKRILENFNIICLHNILRLSWKDKTTHDELYNRTQISSIETIMAQRHLRWLGNTMRMPEHRLQRRILYGQLAGGNKSQTKELKFAYTVIFWYIER
ncbi:uncharacterized protein LOC143040451 [Oratosquilla oratoria]|uniref:uncharacterized protein LOC143040451 n=1 Tax=Oratosquilla oratoria TaxID=337810 RepID=UPI003F7696E1